ncbi:MAG: hypothetical protein KKB35_05820, partial [Proteobacteria bacterium]|nr:hypothetical protein [Pseudomonadota bacterium]
RAEIKELKIGIGIDADNFNPREQTTSLVMNICELVYDTLFHKTADGKLEPRLVTGYDVSQDGLTYTLHVRKGVTFSDGTPLDGKALKENFDQVLNPEVRVPQRFVVSMIKTVKLVDDYTISLELKYPFAPFADRLALITVSPVSPAAMKKYGQDVRKNPVGAGPYIFKEWVKSDRIVLVRNEKYYGRRPTVERLVYKIVPEGTTREAMLRTGQLDIIYDPMPSNVAGLQADPNLTVEMPLKTKTIFMGMNFKKGVTTNKLVRQAFNYAVDKKAIVKKILFDTAVPMEGPMSPLVFGFHKMDKQYDYNPEKAKALLKEANFDFSKTVQMRTPNGRYLFDRQISEAIQAYLQAIGVKVELRSYDWPTYVAGLLKPIDKSELELFLLGWRSSDMDADIHLWGQFHSSSAPPKGLGAAHYDSPDFDKAIEATRLEQDPAKRLALFKKASEIVWDDAPWIWLHVEKFLIVHRTNIKGLELLSTEMFYPTYATMD